jgi:hypothetical protein
VSAMPIATLDRVVGRMLRSHRAARRVGSGLHQGGQLVTQAAHPVSW